ncbi:MAG: asparagine synthase-related protein [Planctomycetaceae bacterium]
MELATCRKIERGNHLERELSNGQGAARKLLAKYVPTELFERPKIGFGVPLDEWLRTSLRDWAEDRLSVARSLPLGYTESIPIRQLWQEHLTAQTDWQYLWWDVLMFQEFLEAQS